MRQQKRFAAYMEGLAGAVGHADRHTPLKNYCTGLLLPGGRKSVEPMAARLAPDSVRRTHQSLHHLVAKAPWNDEEMLAAVRLQVLPTMQRKGAVVAWIVDDTRFPKQGKHSVGVARQDCGRVGKQENCQAAVSLSVSTWDASLPIAWRLYLPEVWCQDRERLRKAGVPEGTGFRSKPEIALEQIRQAMEQKVPVGAVVAGAGYGNGGSFRAHLTELGLQYTVGIEPSTMVWEPGRGAESKRVRRSGEHRPIPVEQLALGLPLADWTQAGWGQGGGQRLRSRFAAVRVRPAHRDEPHPEEWLLIEWPANESQPTQYWLSTLPAKTALRALVRMAKHRWVVERDHEELKQELGLGHYEGRSWRGFHHHATLCIAAYGFLVAERNRVSPSTRAGDVRLAMPEVPAAFRPRGAPG